MPVILTKNSKSPLKYLEESEERFENIAQLQFYNSTVLRTYNLETILLMVTGKKIK